MYVRRVHRINPGQVDLILIMRTMTPWLLLVLAKPYMRNRVVGCSGFLRCVRCGRHLVLHDLILGHITIRWDGAIDAVAWTRIRVSDEGQIERAAAVLIS